MTDSGTQNLTEQLLAHLLVLLRVASADQVEEARARAQERGERLGAALVALGHATPDAVEGALREALGLAGRTRPRLGDILVAGGHLTREGLQQGLAAQARNGRRLGEVLVELGLCTYAQVYAALEQQARSGPLPTGTTPAPAGGGPRRVAVVDDSPIALAMLESGLSMAGFQVRTYSEPHAALLGLMDAPVDVVLTDMEMPGMNGLELCRRVKEAPFGPLPVIILTANEEDTLRVKGLRAGAEDYVNKAASLEELAARIEGVLRRAQEAQRVRHVFARYTSAAVVEEALKRPTEVALEGERREVTVLFADLRRFTPLAEALPPEQTVSVLNEVLRRLADAVLTCGGTLDKFLGDGLMAVWGAPVQRPDDPLRALQAAKMMMASVEELKRGVGQGTYAQVELGVGLNTGLVVAGNVGSAQRTEYTCIGDAVNVAARLCGLAAPGDILMGERTWRLVAGHGHFETLAPVQLKGKSHPVPLWRVRRD